MGRRDAQSSEAISGLDRSRQGLKGQHPDQATALQPWVRAPTDPGSAYGCLAPCGSGHFKTPARYTSFMLRASTDGQEVDLHWGAKGKGRNGTRPSGVPSWVRQPRAGTWRRQVLREPAELSSAQPRAAPCAPGLFPIQQDNPGGSSRLGETGERVCEPGPQRRCLVSALTWALLQSRCQWGAGRPREEEGGEGMPFLSLHRS